MVQYNRRISKVGYPRKKLCRGLRLLFLPKLIPMVFSTQAMGALNMDNVNEAQVSDYMP
jgi:hypothetical protein